MGVDSALERGMVEVNGSKDKKSYVMDRKAWEGSEMLLQGWTKMWLVMCGVVEARGDRRACHCG
jgi:hypothetical protein